MLPSVPAAVTAWSIVTIVARGKTEDNKDLMVSYAESRLPASLFKAKSGRRR